MVKVKLEQYVIDTLVVQPPSSLSVEGRKPILYSSQGELLVRKVGF